MRETGKKVKLETQRISKAEFERLLAEKFRENPTASVDTIVSDVKNRLTTQEIGSTELSPQPRPGVFSQIPKQLWYALGIFLVIVAVAAMAVLWKPWKGSGDDPSPTSAPTAAIPTTSSATLSPSPTEAPAQPILSVGFKDPAQTDISTQPDEEFEIGFTVVNQSPNPADNVRLIITPPLGLAATATQLAEQNCSLNEGTVICAFGTVNQGNDPSKIVRFRADQPGQIVFPGSSYQVVTNGDATAIVGRRELRVNVEAPAATTVELSADQLQLAADGLMTTTLRVDVMDQWGQPFAGSAAVRLTVEPQSTGDEAAAGASDPPAAEPLALSCKSMSQISLTPLESSGAGTLDPTLPLDTQMSAVAFDRKNDRLYVFVDDGSNRQGWVSSAADLVTCGELDIKTLPPSIFPNGLILPKAQVIEGTGNWTYQAGTQWGIVQIIAQLVDEQGAPMGEPESTAITLLEATTLIGTPHLYADATNAVGSTAEGILLFNMPAGTPLTLYPSSELDPQGARHAMVAVWVDETNVNTDAEEPILVISQSTPAWLTDNPDDPSNNPQGDDQTITLLANGRPVRILELQGSLRRVAFDVWVNADALETAGTQ